MNELNYCPKCSKKLIDKRVDGRIRKYCENCNKAVYENPVPATAAVCFDKTGKILLVKRSVEPKKGEWCLPGGFLEVDESPEEGVLRELKEETGLSGEVIGIVDNERSESPFYSSVIVLGYFVNIKGGELKAGDDSSDAMFFDPEKLPGIAFQSHLNILNRILKRERFDIDRSILKNIGAYVITSGDHIEIAKEACGGGARVVQYRDKSSMQSEKLKNAKKIAEICKKSKTIFIVNDSISVALLSGADGVHLGQDDLSIRDARKIVPKNFIIGKSTHSLEQALAAEEEGADYIGIGPVFQTPTKENYVPVGVELAKEVVKSVRIPVVAIGGLNLENIAVFKDSEVKNFAMVREFRRNTTETVKKINKMIFKF